jgi:hypothetical protein
MQNLVDYFPPRASNAWKVDAAMENFRIKIGAIENELRYLKTLSLALNTQLTAIQDYLRLSQPWLPSLEESNQKAENLLVPFLAGFFPRPIAVNIGAGPESFFELLLEAGFEVYSHESTGALSAKVSERFKEIPGFHVLERKEIPADFSVLRMALSDFSAADIPTRERLSPHLVETVYSATKERSTEGRAVGKNIIREMRSLGYQWTLLIFRLEGMAAPRFAANLSSVPDMSSGSLFFFEDYHLFEQAYRWAQTALPPFRHLEIRQEES